MKLTPEEIIALAKEAQRGRAKGDTVPYYCSLIGQDITRFATLIRDRTLEEAAVSCDQAQVAFITQQMGSAAMASYSCASAIRSLKGSES